MNKTIQAISK